VTDRGVLAAGILDGAAESLRRSQVTFEVYDETVADPPADQVHAAAGRARAMRADGVVGFGGGSSMDIAKLVALLASPACTQPLDDMFGVGNVRAARLPLVQVPTTAGTGSEVTPNAIITTAPGTKQGVVSPQLLPDLAVLDGELTASLPPHVAAATGIDAMVHAIEAYTSHRLKNPLSDLLAREALSLLGANIAAVCAAGDGQPAGAEARGAMLLGSCYAGLAFANAPVAAVHALAYPLGSTFHVPHGLSNSLMLPHVLDFNARSEQATSLYAELAPIVCSRQLGECAASAAAATGAFVDHFARLPAELGLPTTLREVGVAEADIGSLAVNAMLQTRLLPNNPREVHLDDAERIYRAAL